MSRTRLVFGRIRSARLVACLGLLVVGCGGGEVARRATPPLTATQAALFDDGVDLIADPSALDGRWRDDWTRELEQRIADADEIAIGLVRTVRVDVDPSRRTSYRVIFTVERAFKGRPRGEITLGSRESAAGYSSISRYREHLLERRFVAFIRRASDGTGGAARHFHLTPPSPPLEQRLERLDPEGSATTIKVIEHSH